MNDIEQTVMYCCEHCDFESYNRENITKHYGYVHACSSFFMFKGYRFYNFKTKDDAEIYISYNADGLYWVTPGWYIEIHEEDGSNFYFAEKYFKDAISIAKQTIEKMEELQNELLKKECER